MRPILQPCDKKTIAMMRALAAEKVGFCVRSPAVAILVKRVKHIKQV